MTTQEAFEWFRPTLYKLQAAGFKSICYEWWRSRWGEQCGYAGNITHEQWVLASMKSKLFANVWELYRYEFTQWPAHKDVRFAPPDKSLTGRTRIKQKQLF